MAKTIGVPSNEKQQKKILRNSEISSSVLPDNLTNPENRGDCFAPSARDRILGKNHGFGAVKPSLNNQQGNKGWDTLKSDSRSQGSLLPEECPKIELDQMRNFEHRAKGTPLVTDGKTVARK